MPLTQTAEPKENQVEGHGLCSSAGAGTGAQALPLPLKMLGLLETSAASHGHQSLTASWVFKVHEGLRPHCWELSPGQKCECRIGQLLWE